MNSDQIRKQHLARFPYEGRNMAEQVNDYIIKKYNIDLEDLSHKTKHGIAYKRKGRGGFFAKIATDAKCLILSFCINGQEEGLKKQRELEGKGIAKKRTPRHLQTYTREAWIDLSKVHVLTDIIPYLDEAFEKRP
jgi:hypothetical protein